MLPTPERWQRQNGNSYLDLLPVSSASTGESSWAAPDDASSGFDSAQVFNLVRRYWPLLICLLLLGALAAAALVVFDSPVYKSRVLIEVQGINEAWLRNSIDVASSFDSNEMNIQTQIQLIRSGPFMRRVFERLQSETVPLTPAGTDLFSRLRQRVRPSAQDPIQHMQRGLQVALATFDARPVNRTRLIELTCDSTSPEIASQFVNTVAMEFIDESLRARMQSSQKTNEWLAGQMEETKSKLQEAEERLQEFVQSSGNLFAGQDVTLDDAKLAQLRMELSRIQSDRIAKQTKYELTLKNPIESLPEILDDAGLRAYQHKINDLRREKAALEMTFTAEHPRVKKINVQIAALQANLQSELTGVISRIRSDYESALRQERTLASAYNAQSQRVTSISSKAAEHNALKREVDTRRQMYQSLLVQVNQAGLTNSVPVNPMRLVEESSPARVPYKPKPVQNISFGVIAGLALTVAIVFIREKLDRSVKSPGISRSLVNAPELGVIPSAEAARGSKGLLARWRGNNANDYSLLPAERMANDVSFWHTGVSVLAESFRATLASLLRNHAGGLAPRVILVTSAGPGEGKTLVAANLGIALAETGRRVLLLDGDFRRPRLHQVFQVSNERCLIDLLEESTPIENYGVETLGVSTAVSGLTLLPSRPAGQVISKILYSPRLPAIIERLSTQFDILIIDAPPILNLADARVIARMTDGVILVLRSGITDRSRAIEACRRIYEDGLIVLGTVLNDWHPGKSGDKHYYYYSSTDTKA